MAAIHNGDKRERVMTESFQSPKQLLPLKRAAFILAGVWTAVIVLGAGWYLLREYENTVETARIQASGSLEKDLVYRRWAAGHGGVYVPVSEETPPNPYLSHIENRDVTTTSGLDLTLVNPAYMTRQVHELGREQYGHQGHITSLNPLRPENASDPWETAALRAFEGGETEVAELALIGDEEYLRLMRPLKTEARCLKCHAAQGYEKGDLRGGISVSVPMTPLWTIMYGDMTAATMGFGVVWLLGLGGIGLGASRMRRHIHERDRAEEELKRRTHDLGERLKELNCLYVISKLAEQPDITTEQIIQGTVGIIPSSWQYPELTKARITLEDRVSSTADFRESQWRQASEIVVHGKPIGSVEVYYLTEQPADYEGPFLKEERSLINAIAEQLGRTIQRIRLEEERATLKEQLHQAQKMEAIAQLAGGVAHDFNNLLTVITGCVSLAKDALPDDHKAVESLSVVQEAADQAAGVTRSLLTFSHRMKAKKETVKLQASVETSLRLLRHVLPADIEVETDTACEPIWIHADGTQLQQIIMNLAINARDAMPNGGTLKIAVSKSTPRIVGLASLADPEAPVARLVVSDSGIGMEPDVQERIFEPFFTTKPRGQGTGLGLAIIHSIVEDHDGRIRVQSEPGRGTTFFVELPLVDVDALQGTPEEASSPRRGRGEVVLLAEDNRHVRGILTSALGSLDYEVIQVDNGSALIDCFERHRKRIGLLVIDVDLPKRSGADCLREIRSSGGSAPAIIITARADVDLEKRFGEDTTLLCKPFQIADFSSLVGDVLAEHHKQESRA